MKAAKLISFMLASAGILSLTACGKQDNSLSAPNVSDIGSVSAAPNAPPLRRLLRETERSRA